MRLLLDTHIALWAVVDDARLPANAVELIVDPANEVFVSVASLWEIAIKHALNRGADRHANKRGTSAGLFSQGWL